MMIDEMKYLRRTTASSGRCATLLMLAVLLLPTTVSADWNSIGPYGGTVNEFIQDIDDVIYAALDGRGIYRTTNRGKTWESVVEIPSSVHSISVDRGGTFYAATDDGVYRYASLELVLLTEGLPEDAPATIVRVSPSNSGTIYAGFGEGHGFYKSYDSGESWEEINNGLREIYSYEAVRSMSFDPRSPGIYASLNGRGLRSDDAGATWRELGLYGLLDIQHDFIASQTSYALTEYGIYVTRDGAENWERTFFSQSVGVSLRSIESFVVDPTRAGRLWVGTSGGRILLSTDFGANWEILEAENLRFSAISALFVDPLNSRRVLAGTAAGVFFSNDRGRNWKIRTAGLDGMVVNKVRLHPQDAGSLYLATEGGVYHSPDDGGVWSVLDRGMIDSDVKDLVIDPEDPRRMYIGTGHTYYFSTNSGSVWRPRELRAHRQPRSLLIDPRDPSIVYLGAHLGLLRSTNYGRNWQGWNGEDRSRSVRVETNQILVDDIGRLTIPRRHGVMRALPDSDNWFWLTEDIGTGRVLGIGQAPTDPDRLYAAVQLDDVYHSADGGRTWAPSQDSNDLGDRRLRNVVVDPEDPQTVYAITWEHGIDKSVDGGLTWESIGLEYEGMRIHSLVFDPRDKQRMYAATDRGVFFYEP